jgi:hypothetical protein
MVEATLIYRQRYVYADGALREMVLWQLPQKTVERRQGIKYRLYYGLADGTCLVRYDNESGKGDHRHYRKEESSYRFVSVEAMVADFLSDIERLRGGMR